MSEEKLEMLTAKKVAEKLGSTETKVKNAIKELSIEPDQMKGKCCYYGPVAVEKIKTKLN